MSQFKILYKQKNIFSSPKKNLEIKRNDCIDYRRTKRSQAFDFRRGLVFEEQKPVEPVKKKIDPVIKNKICKPRTKKIPTKKSLPPFVVGKVRHKIHSPPFLHGPKISTEPKKRVPMTPIQSFAPKNYKFKANYVKEPLSTIKIKITCSSSETKNNSPFTPKNLLIKVNAGSNNNKENRFENITVRSYKREKTKDSPVTSNNQQEKKINRFDSLRKNLYATEKPIFGRLNLNNELEKPSDNMSDSLNRNIKAPSNIENKNKDSSNLSQAYLFTKKTDDGKNITYETKKFTSDKHLEICKDNNYSPAGSVLNIGHTSNDCQIPNSETFQSKKEHFMEKVSHSEEINLDSVSISILKQETMKLISALRSPTNKKINPEKNNYENSSQSSMEANINDTLNKKSINSMEKKQNLSESDKKNTEEISCQYRETKLLKMSTESQILINNVDSISTEKILNLNQSGQQDIEGTELTLLSQLSLSPKHCENMNNAIESPHQQVSNNKANDQDQVRNTLENGIRITKENASLVVCTDSETSALNTNPPSEESVEENELNLLFRLSLSPKHYENTNIVIESPQSHQLLSNNEANEQGEFSNTSENRIRITKENASLVVCTDSETSALNANPPSKDSVEENELNLLFRLSSSSTQMVENKTTFKLSPQSREEISNISPYEQNIDADMESLNKLSNLTNETFLKQPPKKVSAKLQEIYLTPQLSLLSLENRSKTSQKKVLEEGTENPDSPIRVLSLRSRVVNVTPSPIKKTPKKKNLHNLDIAATPSPRKLTPSLKKQEDVKTPIVISLLESPKREISLDSNQFIQSNTSIINNKSSTQTIDLLSDDEEEHSMLLANILKKYSSIKTPSPKSNNRRALSSIENIPKISIASPKSPHSSTVSSSQEVVHSPIRTLVLRRRLINVTPSPKKITPKSKKNARKNDCNV